MTVEPATVDCDLEDVMIREGIAVDRADLASEHYDTMIGR